MGGVKKPKSSSAVAQAPPVAPPVADTAQIVSADDVGDNLRDKRFRRLRFLSGVSSAFNSSVLGGLNG